MPEVIEQEKELQAEALTITERAKAVVVQDQASYDSACNLLQQEIIPFRKRWSDYWAPLRESAWSAYKAVQGRYKEADEVAAMAERLVKNSIRKWDETQERIRQEQQRKAQEEAEKKAEEERIQAAILAGEAGATDAEINAIIEVPVTVVADPVPDTYLKAKGVSTREHWVAVVTDFHSLVKAAAKDKSLLPYLQANQPALNKRAAADRQTLKIPGVLARNDAIVSARGGR